MTSIQQLCWVSIQADFPIHSLTHTFRKTYRGLLRSLWGFHPHPADPHCCQQLRSVLQEQALEERGSLLSSILSANDEMKVEHKKKERIKQIAADRRTAQKFFLIQVDCLTLRLTVSQ